MILGIVLDAAMSALLSNCAPVIGAQTMGGIVQYESGWHPWAIGDNTTHKSYFEDSKPAAIALAQELLSVGDNLDVGYAQVNSANFAAYGLDARTAFDPCTNVHTGAAILAENYAGAVRRNWIGHPIATASDVYYQEQYALMHSLSAYNSGGYWASMKYANNVYGIAQNVRVDFRGQGIPAVYRTAAAPASPAAPASVRPAVQRTAAAMPVMHGATAASARYAAGPKGRIVTFQPAWGERKEHLSASRILMTKTDAGQ